MAQKERPKELFRVNYVADIDTTSGMTPFHEETHSESGYLHIKACTQEEAQHLALGQLQSKYEGNWNVGVGDASVANFADIWRDQTNEELLSKYITHVGRDREHHDGSKLGFYERRAAARILSRRGYKPAGEILLKWLNNPQEGIGNYCYGYEHSAAHNEWPDDYLFSEDANPRDILLLAAESLGLMKYGFARADLERLAKDEEIRKKDPKLSLCYSIASKRLDKFTTYAGKGSELEQDILLYIAATSPKAFFRTRLFKGLVSQIIFDDFDYWYASSTKLAERYIEALRRVPDLEIPIIDEKDFSEGFIQQSVRATDVVLSPKINLTSFLARRGLNMDIENLERICAEVLDITRNGEDLRGGSNVYLDTTLFDGTTALVNDGLRKRIRGYLQQKHLFFHDGVIE